VYGEDALHITRWLAKRVQKPQEKINHATCRRFPKLLGRRKTILADQVLEIRVRSGQLHLIRRPRIEDEEDRPVTGFEQARWNMFPPKMTSDPGTRSAPDSESGTRSATNRCHRLGRADLGLPDGARTLDIMIIPNLTSMR